MKEPKRLNLEESLALIAANKRLPKSERLNKADLGALIDGFSSAKARQEYWAARGVKVSLSGTSVTVKPSSKRKSSGS
jgi:hypothetical protein